MIGGPFGSFRFRGAPPPGSFSVVIPRVLIKNAVKRNALRRALYGALEGVSVPLQGIFYLKKTGSAAEISKGLRRLTDAAVNSLSGARGQGVEGSPQVV